MARVARGRYTVSIPQNAARVVERSGEGEVEYAVWTVRGRKYKGRVIQDTNRCTIETDTWHIFFTDRHGNRQRETHGGSRTGAMQRLGEILKRERQIVDGHLSRAAIRRHDLTLTDFLDRWQQSMLDAGRTEKHALQSRHRAEVTLQQAGVVDLAGVTREDVYAALGAFRRRGTPRDITDQRKPRPLSPRTSNHYLKAVKALLRWCQEEGYVDTNPLERAKGVGAEGRETFHRRAITADELERLMVAAAQRSGPCDLPGIDRAMVYLTAFATGFRLNELGVLVPEDFRLDGDQPSIVLEARYTKNRREARQYIPRHVAQRLRVYLKDLPKGEPVWGWATNFFAGLRASKVLRLDLAAAGIEAQNKDGRIDFHALRGSYVTALIIAGVPLPIVQQMARHSDPRLTTKHYTRLTDADLAGAAGRLPVGKSQ